MAGDEEQYCARMVRDADRERWLCALFAPDRVRPAMLALLAFNLEVARARDAVREPHMALIRLQWWREALAEIAGGGPVRRHPIVRAIADAKLDPTLLGKLVDARERDLDDTPFADLGELEAYAAATSGDLAVAAGGEGCRDIGTGYALAGALIALPYYSRQRRNVLPVDLVAAAGLAPETIHEGKAGTRLEATVVPVAKRARELLARAGDVPKPVALQGTLARLWLDRLQRARHDAFAPELQAPHPADIWRLFFANLFGRF